MIKKVENKDLITALYCRLSQDDIQEDKVKGKSKDESNSISNQKTMLLHYAKEKGLPNPRFFVDDGISGTTFERPGFQEMESLVEAGMIRTVVVKDLSRFGRNYIEMGNFLEIKYPSMGVRFITLQENVDTSTGQGLEMMPFHNIFNEWYAAQTSKKIRAVWKAKADNGERVSSTVAYGYKKSEVDSKQWIVDEEAAKVVRYIFQLAIEGLGITKIARRLEKEKILTPTAYYNSIQRKTRNELSGSQFAWSENSVDHILDNRQYTGCTVNFKTSIISYKVHKKIETPENVQIIPNTQEAIIDEDTFNRVQELKQHRRRNTATGRTSKFSGLMYCGDCGSKLYFCAAKSVKENQEFFRCSAYKENRGACSIHFIRNVVLEEMVLEAIKAAARYVSEYEPVFLYRYAKNHDLSRAQNLRAEKQKVEQSKRRISELDRLIKVAFEKSVLGGMQSELYDKMLADYQTEQKMLIAEVADRENKLSTAEVEKVDLRSFLTTIRKCTELTELTPSLVNTLIRKIEIFDSVKINGKKHVPIKVHFTAAGIIDIPDEKEILQDMEELRKNPSKALKTA